MICCKRNAVGALTFSLSLVLAAALARPALAQGSDDLWEISSKIGRAHV